MFLLAVKNTCKYMLVTIPVTLGTALCISVILQQITKGQKIFRLSFLYPIIMPIASIVLVIQFFFKNNGFLNLILNFFYLPEKRLVMDRTKSGIVDFGKNSVPHEIEAHDRRKTTSINYIDDFALATWAPIKKENKYALDIFIDKCSVEIFLNGGKIAMTNLVFPSEPYNRMCFYSKGGTFNVDSFNAYRLGL